MVKIEFLVAIVGRYAHLSGWTFLLREDGIPFRCFRDFDQIDVKPYFVIYLDGPPPSGSQWQTCPALWDYHYPPGVTPLLLGWAEILGYEEEVGFVHPFNAWIIDWEGDSFGFFRLARQGESPQYPLACIVGQDTYVLGNISEMLIAHGYSFRPAVSEGESEIHLIHPTGRKEVLRRFMREILKSAFKRAGLPYVRLATNEPGNSGTFIFRIDVDYLVEPEMKKLRRIVSYNHLLMTLFVNISGEEKWEDDESFAPGTCQPIENLHFLKDVVAENHEVASHGYYHSLKPHYRDTFEDIRKTKNTLEKLIQAEVIGHAFPGGVWTTVAAKAATDAGIQYTSEASIAWGGNPFSMTIEETADFPIQIPCSPIFPSYHMMGEKMLDTFLHQFESTAQNAKQVEEPLSLMGHPFDLEDLPLSFWDTIRGIVKVYGFKPATMSQLFWNYRKKKHVHIEMFTDKGNWYMTCNKPWEIISDTGRIKLQPGEPPVRLA